MRSATATGSIESGSVESGRSSTCDCGRKSELSDWHQAERELYGSQERQVPNCWNNAGRKHEA